MIWQKTGKNYIVECSDSGTKFNFHGMIIKQPVMSQKEANQWLNLNGYESFEEDKPKKTVKKKIVESSLVED